MQYVNRLIGVFHIFLVVITPIYAQYRYGDIRLVGGSYQWEGRVEIFLSETWGTITDSKWTNNDAQVVCRKLGHFKPGATAHTDAYFGEGSGPIHLDFVQCSGSEYNLTECEIGHDRVRTNHSFDVGVKCQPADEAYRKGDIRLVGGSYNWKGRVEIYWTGTWGTISDSSWSDSDAEVVCRQLGHSTSYARGYYEESFREIYIQEVNCIGSERNITSCSYTTNTVVTTHSNDVAVICQRGNDVKEGDIRLIPGSYLWQGLVEIFLNGVWGTINYVGARSNDAPVVCRQLGYNTFSVDYDHRFRQLGEVIHITELACYGSEYRITDCGYSGDTVDLSHHDDWNVYCHVGGPETGDIQLSNYYGYLRVFLSGSWEPVTDSSRSWTIYNSEVVCRELGYNGTSTYNPRYYTGGLGTIKGLIDHVHCIGTESKLTDCSHDINLQSYYASPRLECPQYDCGDGDIRLVNGDSEMEGRVEICNNGRWGTVCDSQWTDNHTAVVCRQLGFSDIIGNSTYFTSGRFGEGSGPVFIDYINCNGSESMLWGSDYRSLRKCFSFTHYYGCSHSGDVGVRCRPASCTDGQIRLIKSCYSEYDDDFEGRVAICSNQRWETISNDYWGFNEALVACNALGYDDADYRCCLCGRSGSPIHQKHFQCRGTELDLSQCESYRITSQPQDQGVGISCFGDCTDGEVRLVGGESEFEGRVEMCLNTRWGTVSSDGWTQTNSEVVCNDLGYDYDGAVVNLFVPRALSKPVYLHNIVCSSTDLNLMGCSFSK